LEQHSEPDAQALPRVLQAVLSGAHIPLAQFWLQQLPFDEHA
jgi:hypothetical protein